jgi:hypothetical protein
LQQFRQSCFDDLLNLTTRDIYVLHNLSRVRAPASRKAHTRTR